MSAVDILNEHDGIDFEAEKIEHLADAERYACAKIENPAQKVALIEQVTTLIHETTKTMSIEDKGKLLHSIKVKSTGDLKRLSTA